MRLLDPATIRALYMTPFHKHLAERLHRKGVPFKANDTIADHIALSERDTLRDGVKAAVQNLLDALVIDTVHDHNTVGTAERVARMYVDEVFRGRYHPRPKVTDFPNAKGLDEVYTVGPITVRSACSHHLVPIVGNAWVGVIPGERVIGLSKFNRLTEWVMARPQIQEEAAIQLADEIEALIKPKALAVVIKASHMCMTWRGVREASTSMTTSVMRGLFREDPAARTECMRMMAAQGFGG
jgi:GTP cyclohydrolase IA